MILAALLGGCAVVAAQVSGSPVRHVRERPGWPIADAIRAGEEALVVESMTDPGLEIRPGPGVSQIEWATKGAPAIVVVDVLSIEGELTPRQDWIRSNVTASLVDILKLPKEWSPKIADLVTFDMSGGEAYVGGTKVLASVPSSRPMEVGKRYLMFVGPPVASPNRLRGEPYSAIYEMTESGGFRRLSPSGRGPDDIETTEQAVVLMRIRDAVQ